MVIICDCHYRSAICAIRSFYKFDKDIVAVVTKDHPSPPAFSSRYVKEKHFLSDNKDEYTKELLKLCKRYDRPILFPVGNFSLNVISENLDEFYQCADFCVSVPTMLADLNDKKWVKNKAIEFGIKVPERYSIDSIAEYPVVVKPFCGEKFSQKAADRYRIAQSEQELNEAYQFFKQFDDEPIIEKYIPGNGFGVNVLFNNECKAENVFCHRRIVEYPINGGPSALLETAYNEEIINNTVEFFEKIGFCGIAMAEFKESDDGYYLLEINPRIWGSFPSTYHAKSDFIESYIRAARGINCKFSGSYKRGKKIKFIRGLGAAFLSYLKSGKFLKGISTLLNLLNPFVPDALFTFTDPIPFFKDLFRR